MNSERIEVRDEYDNLLAGIEIDVADQFWVNMTIRTGHPGSITMVSDLCLDLESAKKVYRKIGLAIKEANKQIDRLCPGEGAFESEDEDGTF